MGKVVKLIMVTENNNNKYYSMFEQTNGTFNVEYGRVDSTKQHASYPMYQWDKKLNEKLRKGYKDITELYAIDEDDSKSDESFISNDLYVKQLIEDLQKWATNTVKSNYNVSTKNVTQKMVDEAQAVIDKIASVYSKDYTQKDLNELLLQLFTIIPRKMGNVKDYLVRDNDTKDRIAKIIDEEQSLLDTMAGQVSMQEPKKEVINEDDKKETKGLLDSMGISVKHVTDLDTISKVKKLMGDSSNLFNRLFEVRNFKTEERYNKLPIENEELLFHGSKSANYLNIIMTGLLIRPSCAAYTGSMWGSGIYHASSARKSIGYTSLSGSYWARGSENKAYLTIFKVNLGKKKVFNRHDSSCYNLDKENIRPYNSVHALAGASIINDEFITYEPERCTIKYLIELKK